jgi:hypothetical protein
MKRAFIAAGAAAAAGWIGYTGVKVRAGQGLVRGDIEERKEEKKRR